MSDERKPLAERFPELDAIEGMDDSQRIDTFSKVLDALKRELDEQRA